MVIYRRPGANRRNLRGLGNTKSFNPQTSIPGLEAYWRLDQGVTTSTLRWKDLSGSTNKHDAHNSIASRFPELIQNDSTFNGHSSVQTSGGLSGVQTTLHADFDYSLTGGYTRYMVMQMSVTQGWAGSNGICQTLQVDIHGGNTIVLDQRNAADTADYSLTSPAINDGVARLVIARWDGTTLTFQVGSWSGTTVAPDIQAGSSVFAVGAYSRSASDFSTSRILESNAYIAAGSAEDTNIVNALTDLYLPGGSGVSTFDFSTITGLIVDLNGDEQFGPDITAIADQSGGTVHDLSYNVGDHFQQIVQGYSKHFTKDTATVNLDGLSPGKMLWNNGALDASAGEKLNIYFIGRMNSPKGDAEGNTLQGIQNNSGTGGWIIRTQKAALGDKLYEYAYDGSSAVQTAQTDVADAVWAPGAGQVLRWEIDGDGTSNTMRSGKGAADKTWSMTGHTPQTGSGYIGHTTAGTCPAMEVAAILIYKSTSGITQGQHDQLVQWAHNTFMKPFDPLTQIDGANVEAYYRMDQGVTTDSSNHVTALADQSGNGIDLAVSGIHYWKYNSSMVGFKTPTITSIPADGSNLSTLVTTAIEPAPGERLVIYAALKWRPSPSVGVTKPILSLGPATTRGWAFRTQTLATRMNMYQSAAGVTLFDNSGVGSLTSGGFFVVRGDVDETSQEVLAQVDDGENIPKSGTGNYTPSAGTDYMVLGASSPTATVDIDLAGILILSVKDRVPQGVHRKITAFLRQEFFTGY